MDSSKSKDSSNSGRQDSNPDTTDEDKPELCPGFKDADAFVKVSKKRGLCFKLASGLGNVGLLCLSCS